MSAKDSMAKEYFADNARFADLCNNILYGGREVILPENLKERDTTEVLTALGLDKKTIAVQKLRDIFKNASIKYTGKSYVVLIGVENQSDIHYAIPVKNMFYDVMAYGNQVKETAKKHRKDKDTTTSDEFLSGFTKEDKLIPVITITVYLGTKEWDGPRKLSDMFGDVDEELLPFIPDYRINLLAPREITDFTGFRTSIRQLFEVLKNAYDKEKMQEVLQNDEKFSRVDRETVEAINLFAGTDIDIDEKEEVIDMCKAWEEQKNEGREEGREKINRLNQLLVAEGRFEDLKKSLEDGKITEAEIDSACRRILIAKYQLGLFHDPYKYCNPKRAAKEFLSVNNVSAARRIAAESFVLLKNDNNLLPLKGCRKVAVVGPLADSKANMAGSWKYDEQTKSYHGLVEDLQESLGNGVEVVFAKGSNLVDDPVYEANFTDQNRSTRDDRSDEQLIAEALKVVEGADVIIAALGESIDMSGEGASRAILEMPQTQKKLLDAIQKTGKPIVMVLFTGRPLALQSEEKQVNAILNVWFGGTEAGAAIADVLTGKVSPTGKLTMSFPRVTGQCPIYYNHKMTGRPMSPDAWYTRYVSNYIDVLNEPLYPFGYGLSYTTYTYGDVSLNMNSMDANGKIQASVIVTNTGAQDGEEIVQLYLRDIVRSITPPVQELKGFKRVALKAGESKKVTFDIDVDMLKFYDSTLDYVAEPGEFQVMIGGNSKEVKTASFTLK